MAGYIMAVENHTDVYFEHRSLEQITGDLSELLMRRHLHLTTAESCTGGKLASALCAAENTPEWFMAGRTTGKTGPRPVRSGLAGALTIAPKPQLNALAASVKRYWTRP